ncbi:hypothetical protein [Nocardia sp. NPDC052316]|uniref:hypothetical protein n=1 Tax=Nocardia sp. NPDC052316 TaxID=3364329 RepID=UPI0037C69B7B
MSNAVQVPLGIKLSADIEKLDRRRSGNLLRAQLRWNSPSTKRRHSKSETFETEDLDVAWIARMKHLAQRGVDPVTADPTLAEYRHTNTELALKGLEPKPPTSVRVAQTSAPHDRALTRCHNHQRDHRPGGGAMDRRGRLRKVHHQNTIAALVRLMEQARPDGLIDLNPARVRGWQALHRQIEDEPQVPRALALPDWQALVELSDAPSPHSATPALQQFLARNRPAVRRNRPLGSIAQPQ